MTNLEGEEDLFKLLASTEWEYASFRGGKIGREVKSNVPDAAAFDIQSFIMGEAIKDKMNAISKDQDQRLKEQEERRRFRRDI